jgi:DNA-binding transcriptional LysR family regulator
MDRFEIMRVYIRVSELASFSKAAESLGLPKATVSTAVQQLEAQLGTRLLHRTTRQVQMTQDGQIYFERCKDLLSDVEELESLFKKDARNISGRLRVDMPQGIARNLVLPQLNEFLKKYPSIEVELSSTDRRVDLIAEGFDCVIRVGKLVDSGLIARNLGQLSIINCVSPGYIKEFGKPKSIADLANHYLVHYSTSLGAKPEGFEYFDGEAYTSVQMKGRITVNNSDAYNAACVAGFGIVQVPAIGMKTHLENKTIIEVLPELKAEAMPVSIIYPHRRNLSKRVQVFMDWIAEIMKYYAS